MPVRAVMHVVMLTVGHVIEVFLGDVVLCYVMLGVRCVVVVEARVANLLVLSPHVVGAIGHEILRHLLSFRLLNSPLLNLQPSQHSNEHDENQNSEATPDD